MCAHLTAHAHKNACRIQDYHHIVGSLLFLRGAAYLFNMLVLAPPFDPLRNLPGPKGTAFQNHFRQVLECVCCACC